MLHYPIGDDWIGFMAFPGIVLQDFDICDSIAFNCNTYIRFIWAVFGKAVKRAICKLLTIEFAADDYRWSTLP